MDRTGSWNDALQAARRRAKLADDAALRWFEREPGRFDRLLGFFGDNAVRALAQAIGFDPAMQVPWALAPQAAQDLGWLAEIAARREPFAAVVHCMCEPAR